MLLASNSCRPNVKLPAGSMSRDWSGAKRSSSAVAPTCPLRWWARKVTRSNNLEMAHEKTPLSLASIDNWWSKLLSASRIDRPRSRWAAAIAWDRLLLTLCNYSYGMKSLLFINRLKNDEVIEWYLGRRQSIISFATSVLVSILSADLIRGRAPFQQDLFDYIELILQLFDSSHQGIGTGNVIGRSEGCCFRLNVPGVG